MRNGQMVLVACKIGTGAFSRERVFRLPMAGDRDEYIGIAPVDHCRDSKVAPLDRDQPPAGSEIDGYIDAFLISNGGAEARVELPDGEAITIPAEQVKFLQTADRGPKYVSVGS